MRSGAARLERSVEWNHRRHACTLVLHANAPISGVALQLLCLSIEPNHFNICTMSQQNRRFLRVAVAEAIVLALGVAVLVLLTLAVEGNAQLITEAFRLR